MRWFKHYSDNYRGRSVGKFYKDFGHTGVSWYYLLTEICSEKLEKSATKDIEKADCEFNFDVDFIKSSLRCNLVKLERWLSTGQALGLWSYKITESELSVKYPILLELLDSDSIKTRSRRVEDAGGTRLDIEKIKKENNTSSTAIAALTFDFEDAYNLYPKKIGKTLGIKKLSKEIKTLEDFELLKTAIKKYSEFVVLEKKETQYIKQFSTFAGSWREWLEYVPVKPNLTPAAKPSFNRDRDENNKLYDAGKKAQESGLGLIKAAEDPAIKNMLSKFLKKNETDNEKN